MCIKRHNSVSVPIYTREYTLIDSASSSSPAVCSSSSSLYAIGVSLGSAARAGTLTYIHTYESKSMSTRRSIAPSHRIASFVPSFVRSFAADKLGLATQNAARFNIFSKLREAPIERARERETSARRDPPL